MKHKKRKKSLIGWTYSDWKEEFRHCYDWVDIPLICPLKKYVRPKDFYGSEKKVKVRIIIEEIR